VPLVRRPSRSTRPTAALGLGIAAVLLAGVGSSPAGASRHAPCPTAGTTLVRDTYPNLRVYRQGGTLRACTRRPGEARRLRKLDPWSTATTLAADDGTVAWTTRRSTDAGPADAVAAMDVASGRRWLSAVNAAVAPDAATPATADRVLRLVVNPYVVGWVTARGVVAAAVRTVDDPEEAGSLASDSTALPLPYRDGRRYHLGDAGPADAPRVAKGLRLYATGESDECGGTDILHLEIPAFGSRPETTFTYAQVPHPADPDIC
jgi:hypothetical protein